MLWHASSTCIYQDCLELLSGTTGTASSDPEHPINVSNYCQKTQNKSTCPEDSDQWFSLTEHINLKKFNRKRHNRNIFLFKCLVDTGKIEKLMDVCTKTKVGNNQ